MKSVKMNDLIVVIFNSRDLGRSNMYDTLEILYNEIDEHNLFILDLTEIRHLSDEAAGSLIFLQSYLEDRKKSLRMYQSRDQVRKVYEKLNLDSVMSMAYKTTDDLNDDENMVFYIN